MANKEETLAKIAADILGVETLEERRSDSLDFREVFVLDVRAALEAAYAAGAASAQKPARK